MRAERWQQVKRVLDASLEQRPEELEAWLDEACAGDADLRAEVAKLLSFEDRLDSFRAAAPVNVLAAADGAAVGAQVGPYRIRELLARGGMGAVYRAERTEGFRQTVALKLVRAGLESPQALDRFQREREILAGLEHPNIARLLDGATGGDGRPYFAMELVDGEPIDRYCDRHGLSVRRRLELLLPVCDALLYAHRQLVVHRDLKPGNLMVDRQGTPKLLDFGIAKLVESDATTEASGGAMTPRYASPEQLLERPVSTASDVYSLGVVLYLLLTGRLPCGLDECSGHQVLHRVCEVQPRPPSAAVAETVEVGFGEQARTSTPEAVAAARGCDPRSLKRRLRGDLDAIALKALRKEPERRYVSVEQLAADLRRHLDGHPVSARRGTFTYRAGRFARRHRWRLATAAAMVAMLLGFTVLLARQLGRTEAARDRAERERDRAERVSTFLVDLFRAAEPGHARAEPSVRSLVDDGRRRLEHELADVPVVRAELLNTLGQVYDRLGHTAAAGETLEASLEILRRIHPGDHADVARALNDLAVQAYRRGDYERSERYSRECIEMRQRLGLEDDLIKPRSNLAAVLRLQGRLGEAAELYQQGLGRRRARWGDRHPNVAVSLSNLGITHYLAGDLDAAEPLLEEALEIRRAAFGPDSVGVASVLVYLGRLDHARGELAPQRSSLAARLSGPAPPHDEPVAIGDPGSSMRNRLLDAAERRFVQALEIRRRRLGPDHLRVAVLEADLADLLLERGDVETAGILIAGALATLHRHKPEGDPILAEAQSVYGAYLAARGRRAEAEVCLRSSLGTLEAIRGANSLPTRQARRRLDLIE